MIVWLGNGPGGIEELFLAACAGAGIPGAAEPVAAEGGIRCVAQVGSAGEPPSAGCDVLAALDAEALGCADSARRLVLYDGEKLPEPAALRPGAAAMALPSSDPAAAAATLAWLAGVGFETLRAAWSRRLRGESTESAAMKIQAARRACEAAAMQLGCPLLSPPAAASSLPLVCGPQALGLGALAAGCTCLFVPDGGRSRGPASWLLSAAERAELASLPVADETAALAAAAGAAAAGARALADLTSGRLAAAAEMLETCAECGIPAVVLAADDGWRWPRGLPVAELRPAGLREARLMTAEAFDIAESLGVPVVVRAGPGLLGRWESWSSVPDAVPIVRSGWSGPAGRPIPGLEGPVRVTLPLGPDELTRRRAALEEAPAPSAAGSLFPVPAAATLEERESLPPEDFLPGFPAGTDCAAAAVLKPLARAWSAQGLQPKDIFVAAGGSCCLPEPAFPRTYGMRVPAGCAAAAALGVKLANPALTVAAFDDASAVFRRGLAGLLHAVRGNHDVSILLWERGEGGLDLLEAARLAGASFLARFPAGDEAAGAALAEKLAAHKGCAVAAVPCGEGGGARAGLLQEPADRPVYGESQAGVPVAAAIDRRPELCSRLLEGLS